MSGIITPVVMVVVIGLVLAVVLTVAAKVFFVPVDETQANLRAELPGANCGACGFAGCDDYSSALAKDHSLSTALCPVGGAAVAEKLAAVLGVEAAREEPKKAVVRCNGNCDARADILEWKGINTCSAARQFFGGMKACAFGCIGLGDCERVCDYQAIQVCNGVAVVNRENCVACGRCAKGCPTGIISLIPERSTVVVQCSSTAKGAVARKQCSNACIGCMKCTKVCKFEAISVENNLARIDPDKCKNCGLCMKECPTGAIINMRIVKPKPKLTPEQIEAMKAAKAAKEAEKQAEQA